MPTEADSLPSQVQGVGVTEMGRIAWPWRLSQAIETGVGWAGMVVCQPGRGLEGAEPGPGTFREGFLASRLLRIETARRDQRIIPWQVAQSRASRVRQPWVQTLPALTSGQSWVTNVTPLSFR